MPPLTSIWACFRFPDLPRNVFDWPDNTPAGVEETRQNQRLIVSCNTLAKKAGVQVGMNVPTAYSLCDQLALQPRSIRAEEKYLRELALWAYQFSATVTLKMPNCLLLELGSCLGLYPDWLSMREHIQTKLDELDVRVQFSAASTPAAAFLLSQANIAAVAEMEQVADILPTIDVRFLDTEPRIYEALNGMGITHMAQLLALPRAGLAKRFGQPFAHYLQRLLGEVPDPQPAFSIPLHFQDEFDFVEEVEYLPGIQFALKRLLGKLEHYLRARQKQVQQYQITLLHRKQQQTDMVVHFSSRLQTADELFKMAQLKLETITLAQPVIGLRLSANRFLAQQEKAKDLFGEQQAQEGKYSLLDKLQMRLGDQRCYGVSAAADHRPERAWQQAMPEQALQQTPVKQRPLWLLVQPQPLLGREGKPVYFGPLQLVNGPERIETGWWDNQPVNRDYFIAKQAKGALYWVFFERDEKKWYVHGLFA